MRPTNNFEIGIDYSLYNVEAEQWALQNAGSTYPDLSQEQIKTIRQAVAKFIKKSGFTVGDVAKILRKYFDEERAFLIARTEITRAYAYSSQIEGEKTKKEYPDVRVTKTWLTCNDDQVCEVCGSLHEKEVDINKPFAEGVFIPPAHEGCRCSISSSTRI